MNIYRSHVLSSCDVISLVHFQCSRQREGRFPYSDCNASPNFTGTMYDYESRSKLLCVAAVTVLVA